MNATLRLFLLGTIAVMILLPGCTTTETMDNDTFRAVVDEIFVKYRAANLSKDADAYLSLWVDNPIKVKPKKPPIIGRTALGEMKRGSFSKWNILSYEINVEEVQVDRKMGFARGTGKSTMVPVGGGDSVVSEAKFLTIFKRQPDGSWKIYCDVVN